MNIHTEQHVTWVLGFPALLTVGHVSIIYSWLSTYEEGTLYPSLCIKHSTNCELCSTIVFTIEKNLKEFKSTVCGQVFIFRVFLSVELPVIWWLWVQPKRNCQMFLQSGCIVFQSHQQWMRVRVPPYPQQHVLISVFDSSHPSGYETLSHWGFDFHFPDDMMLKTFHVFFLLLFVYLLWRRYIFKFFAYFES